MIGFKRHLLKYFILILKLRLKLLTISKKKKVDSMKTDNDIPTKTRLKELFIDYLVILAYLFVLLLINLFIYWVIIGHVPEFNQWQSQFIATFTSVIPIVLIFSYLDYRGGSIGKKRSGLYLYYEKLTYGNSLLRNMIKFLPWQLGHSGVIRGIYTDFDAWSIILTNGSLLLLVIMLGMGLFRKDKRHVGDLLAGSQVQIK